MAGELSFEIYFGKIIPKSFDGTFRDFFLESSKKFMIETRLNTFCAIILNQTSNMHNRCFKIISHRKNSFLVYKNYNEQRQKEDSEHS
jgi:hypothetical protein